MKYRLSWLETWSTKHEAEEDQTVRHAEQSDGWIEHTISHYFVANNDENAKKKAQKYVNDYWNVIEV